MMTTTWAIEFSDAGVGVADGDGDGLGVDVGECTGVGVEPGDCEPAGENDGSGAGPEPPPQPLANAAKNSPSSIRRSRAPPQMADILSAPSEESRHRHAARDCVLPRLYGKAESRESP